MTPTTHASPGASAPDARPPKQTPRPLALSRHLPPVSRGPRVTSAVHSTHPDPEPTCGGQSLANPVPTLCPAAHTGVRYSPDGAVPGPESTDGYRCTPVCCSAVR